jgi:hypothetical protein
VCCRRSSAISWATVTIEAYAGPTGECQRGHLGVAGNAEASRATSAPYIGDGNNGRRSMRHGGRLCASLRLAMALRHRDVDEQLTANGRAFGEAGLRRSRKVEGTLQLR